MIRILWLLIVGSWRFPWEKKTAPPPALPRRAQCYHPVEDTDGEPHRCEGWESPLCSDGRCRWHCAELCKCEERPLIEAPHEPKPPHSEGAYR